MDPDVRIKVIFLGDAGVGKSSILKQYLHNNFQNNYDHTIGVDFYTNNIKFKERVYKLSIWDTAGQERFNSIISSYFKESTVGVFVFDITDKTSFNNVFNWLNMYNKYSNEHSLDKRPIIIVGNKLDRMTQREITKDDVLTKLENTIPNYNYDYCEVSAKEKLNLNLIFSKIIEKIENLLEIYNVDELDKDFGIKYKIPKKSFFISEANIKKGSKCCVIS